MLFRCSFLERSVDLPKTPDEGQMTSANKHSDLKKFDKILQSGAPLRKINQDKTESINLNRETTLKGNDIFAIAEEFYQEFNYHTE